MTLRRRMLQKSELGVTLKIIIIEYVKINYYCNNEIHQDLEVTNMSFYEASATTCVAFSSIISNHHLCHVSYK